MRILFATDGSPGSDVALDMLCALRLRHEDHVEVLTVIVHHYAGMAMESSPAYLADVVEEEVADARAIAAEAAARLAVCGVDVASRDAEGAPAEAIVAAAATTESDLIVLGSRGRGLISGTLLGSTARALARHSPIPVLVVRDRREAPRRILVAVDASEDARAAIDALRLIPLARGSEAVLLHIVPDRREAPKPRSATELAEAVERQDRVIALELLRRAAAALPPTIAWRLEVASGSVAQRVLTTASAIGADLIVMGSRGTALGPGFLQGSTADRVLSGAHCAVLVARAAERVKARDALRSRVGALTAAV